MRVRLHTAIGFVAVLHLPALAFGINLTGEWSGSANCKAFDGTLFRLPRTTSTLLVSHSTTTFAARLETDSGPTEYFGHTVQQSGLSTRLQGIMVECRTTPSLADRSEVVHLKAAESTSRARLKGSSIFRDQSGDIGTCRWTFERVNKTAPGLTPCP